ncbi:MAG: hypothetical protein J3R72DRAFT_451820 [Linnemannia gamsii]|nr:MAG: hypothetical protein J3R72DRAFT_451820 [Linnemannia gamsii]
MNTIASPSRSRLTLVTAAAIIASTVLLASPAEAFGCMTEIYVCITHCVSLGYSTGYCGGFLYNTCRCLK